MTGRSDAVCSDGLTALVAITPGGVIGHDGDMPWRLSSDLRRFKKLTMGAVLIMGRKTYESIGRPLPGRETIVITRDPNWSAEGVSTAKSPAQAIERVGQRRAYVVGGAEIYRQLLPHCQNLLLTRVLADIEGDTVLDLDLSAFELIERSEFPASDHDQYPTEFLRLIRKSAVDASTLAAKN